MLKCLWVSVREREIERSGGTGDRDALKEIVETVIVDSRKWGCRC